MATQYNVNLIGSLTNTNGVLSGFSSGNYATLKTPFSPISNDWEVCIKFTTGESYTTDKYYYLFSSIVNNWYGISILLKNNFPEIEISNNNSEVISGYTSTLSTALSTSTNYYLKLSFNGSVYTLSLSDDGSSFTSIGTLTSSLSPYSPLQTTYLGRTLMSDSSTEWFNGAIDLNGSYITIDNNYFWRGVTNTTTIQLRRDTASNWSTVNPTLASGEVGIETDTRKQKFGDGTTAWNSLPYSYGSTALQPDSISTMVTTDTAQTISGLKTFNSIKTDTIYNTSSNVLIQDYSGTFTVGANNKALKLRGNTIRPQYQNGNGTPSDLALYSDIPSDEIFIATYGTTTYSEITTALANYKTVICNDSGRLCYYIRSVGGYTFGSNFGANAEYVFVDSNDTWGRGSIFLATKDLSNVTSIDSSSAVQTALDDKANISLNNLSATGKTVIDGQWTSVNVDIGTSDTSLNGSTELSYTLSTIPDDGHKYEAMVSIWGTTGGANGNSIEIQVRSDELSNWINVNRGVTRTSSAMTCSGNIILPLSTSRKLYIRRKTDWTGVFTAQLKGYRRIGSNT